MEEISSTISLLWFVSLSSPLSPISLSQKSLISLPSLTDILSQRFLAKISLVIWWADPQISHGDGVIRNFDRRPPPPPPPLSLSCFILNRMSTKMGRLGGRAGRLVMGTIVKFSPGLSYNRGTLVVSKSGNTQITNPGDTKSTYCFSLPKDLIYVGPGVQIRVAPNPPSKQDLKRYTSRGVHVFNLHFYYSLKLFCQSNLQNVSMTQVSVGDNVTDISFGAI